MLRLILLFDNYALVKELGDNGTRNVAYKHKDQFLVQGVIEHDASEHYRQIISASIERISCSGQSHNQETVEKTALLVSILFVNEIVQIAKIEEHAAEDLLGQDCKVIRTRIDSLNASNFRSKLPSYSKTLVSMLVAQREATMWEQR